MTIVRIVLAIALLCIAEPAFACSQDELQAKAVSLGELVNKLAKKDPSTADAWKQKQIAAAQVAESTTDIDTICAAYDKAIAEARASQ